MKKTRAALRSPRFFSCSKKADLEQHDFRTNCNISDRAAELRIARCFRLGAADTKSPAQQRAEQGLKIDQRKSGSFRRDQPPQSGCVAALFGVIVLFCAGSGSSRPVQPNRQPAQPPTEPDCSHRRWRGSPVRWKERGWRWGQCRPPSHSGSRKSAR